jgi:hypothetical protein
VRVLLRGAPDTQVILRIFVAAMALAATITSLTKDRWPSKCDRLRRRLPRTLGIIATLTFVASVWLAIEDHNARAKNARLAAIVTEVDRREDFQPLAASLRDSIRRRIDADSARTADERGDIPIWTNGNRQNIALALEVESLLGSALIAPKYQTGIICAASPLGNTGRVWMAGQENMIPTLESLRPVLSVIFRDSITIHAVDDVQMYGLWFLEIPRFDSLGRVSFR